MITVVRNYFAFLLAVALCCVLATPLSAQDLQPKRTGLPGRTVWALATSASAGSGTTSVTTFAATDKGLWRSGDNGTSWTETTLKNIAVYAVKSRDIGRTSTLLVGTDKGVLRSTDGGNSWASPEVTTGTVSTSNIVALKKVFDIEVVGNAWFAATEKGVYRSNNDGRSWSLVNIDRTADNNEVRGITVDGNTVIVNLWKEGLWRSTNNGNSWTKLTIGNESTPSKSVFAHTGTLWIQQGKQTTTATASMLFAGAVSGNIWRSTDNGSTWTKTFSAGTALRTASASATGVDAMTAIGNRLVSGAPNGLAFSNDNGRTWQTVRTTLPQPTTLAVDKQTLFVGLQSAPSAMTTAEKGASELTEAQPGIATYSVYNVGQTSCATPAVTGFSPPSTVTGSGALTITVNGQNFTPTTILRVERINAATNTLIDVFGIASGQSYDGASCTYISPTALSFTVPSSWRTVGSRIGFTPYTDADCGTVAGSGYTFLVNVPLSITSISPNSILRRSSTTPITITGTSFISGVTRVYGSMNGQPRVQLTPSSISSSSIGIDIDGLTFIGNGIITITVEDNNGGSASSTIAVPNAPPVISSVSPTSIFTGTVESYVSGFIGTYVSISGTALYVPSGLGIFGGIQGNYILGGANDQTTFYGSLNGQPRISLQRDVSSYNGSTGVSTVQLQIPPSLVSAGGTLVITAENVEIAQTGTISVSIINPLPTINSISPTSAVRGGGSVAATVTGTNFVPGSQVILTSANGRIPARTTYVSPTQLNTFWEAAALLPSIAVDSYAVTVENPTPGGGASPQSQPLSVLNPVPIAAGLIPAQVIAGVAQPLTITGNGFMAGSQVYFNGQLKSSTFNNGSLSLALDVSDIPTAGDYPIYVTNLGPGGGSSGVLTLYALNYTPSITAFTPTVLSSGQDATLTLSGGGTFASGAVAILYPSGTELTTTFVNTNTLTVTVPGSLLATVSETNYSIRVRNPAPGGGLSAPVTVPVRNGAPSFSGVSPNSLVAAAQDTPLTLTGGNFLSGATALISGPGIGLNTPLTTTVVNANTITATLPAGIAGVVGQYSLIVRNPNSVADSPAQNINIVYPQAQLSSVTPSPIPAQNAAQTLTLTGANFVSGAQVRIQDEATNGQTVNQLLSASVISATQINATLPQTLAERVGRYRLTVDNPAPNAGVSGTVNVDVLALTPTFAALSTTSATMTGAAQTLTLTGTNFVSTAQNGNPQLGTIVEVNGQPVTASVLSATQISLTLPVTLLDSAQVLTIRTVNPALTINGTPQGGGASVTRTFTLLYPAPALSGVAPQVVTANPVSPTPVALSLTGTNFTASSRVLVQRTGTTTVDTLQTTPNNLVGGLATSLALTLPAPLFTDATTFTLRVLTPYGSIPAGFVSGGTSAPQTLTVQNPLPAITTLTPAQSLILQTTTVTITGTNFVQPSAVNNQRGTVAYFGATALPTSVLSPTSIQVTIASALLTVAQNYSITVRNPLLNGLGGGTSNAPTFTALNPTALLDSIVVPNGSLPLVVSSATRTVSVFGQFFVNGVTVTLSRTGGNAVAPQTLSTTFVSPTHVTLSIPTAFLAEAGTLSFQAANPNPTGGASNTLSVAIVNPRPRLFTLTPTTATISASDLALTLDGGNFLPNSSIFVRGTTQGGADTTITLAPTGYTPANATPTRLTVSVPTTFAALAGTYFVWVQNPTPTVSGNTNSDTLSLFMRNPLPTLASVTPATVSTGSGDTTVTLVGTNFTPLASVLLNGATLAANRVVIQDRTTILATIPAALMAQATTLNVQVTIPAPGGGTSVIRTLTVRNALPVLDSIAPATIAAMRDTVITAYGSGFNLTSQFRLIRGATTVTLAIVSLPSSGVARLSIPAAAIITLATYQVRVFNSAPGGGTSVARNLVVQGGPAVSMEFLNVTTGIVAGASLNAIAPGVQVRFRDALGILSDVTADSLYATRLPDAALQDTVRKGLRLTRLSAGLYSVPSTVFTTAGTYTLALETQQMAAMTTLIGNRSFAVRPTVRANVWIEFFNAADSAITSLTATQALAKLNVTYRDRFQNLTDSTVGIVRLLTVAGNPWGASTATLDMQRTSLGLYTLASPLQITTAGTYYLNPAGLSRAVVLTTAMDSLVLAPAAPTAYIRSLRSLVNAGTSQPAFTIIVRDAGSNRVDLVAPRLTYTQLDTLPTGEHVTGEWALTRTALGTYTAPAQLFTVGGLYSFQMTDGLLSVPVSASGLTPDTVFTVLSSVATRLALADADTAVSPLLPDTLRAGGVMPRLRFAFRDASGNLTDNGVTLTSATYRVAVGVSSGTLRLERESVGLYWTSSTFASVFVTAGTYTITVRGIQIDSIMTNGIQPGRRTFVIAPRSASSVLFTGLLPTLTSGAAQARFRATLRDTFNNLTDNVQTGSVTALPLTQVWYSMSTDATVSDSTRQASAGLFTMQRTSLGVFLADAHAPITEAGNYAIGVQGITSTTSGTAAFTVRPNVDYRIVFENVPDTLTAGDSLHSVIVRYFDINDNPTDNSLGRILYTRTGGSSTATIQNTRIGTGVYALTTTQATLAGTYTLSVSGIGTANYQGNRTFVIASAAAVRANFTNVALSINAGAQQSAFDVRFYDQYGNYTDNAVPTSVLYSNATTATGSVSTGTITFAGRTGIGLYDAARVALTTAGNYELAANGFVNTGNRFFVVKPLVTRTVEFADIPDTLWTGQQLPPVMVRFHDIYGNLTNDSRDVTFTKSGAPASTGTIALNPLTLGVYSISGVVFVTPGLYTLSISGISPANTINNKVFNVITSPKPIVTILETNVTSATGQVWTMVVQGSNFIPLSIITLNGVPLTTFYRSSNLLSAQVSFNLGGIYNVSVQNPAPGGVADNSLLLFVQEDSLLAAITNLPATVPVEGVIQPFNITITRKSDGSPVTNFQGTATLGIGSKRDGTFIPLTLTQSGVSGTYTATVPPPASIKQAGNWQVEVHDRLGGIMPEGKTLSIVADVVSGVEFLDIQPYRVNVPEFDAVAEYSVGDTLPPFTFSTKDRLGNFAPFTGTAILESTTGTFQKILTVNEQTPGIYITEAVPLTVAENLQLKIVSNGLSQPPIEIAIKEPSDVVVNPPIVDCVNPRRLTNFSQPPATLDAQTPTNVRTRTIDGVVYDLVWSDEFRGTLLDRTKWNVLSTKIGGSNIARDMERGPNGNFRVEDDILHITARHYATAQTTTANQGTDFGQSTVSGVYTTAGLTTKYKGDWRFAFIEVRAQLPNSFGTDPAIWLLPTDNVPGYAELDIMEQPTGHQPWEDTWIIHSTVHWDDFSNPVGEKTSLFRRPSMNFQTNFNRFMVRWDYDFIKFKVGEGDHSTGNAIDYDFTSSAYIGPGLTPSRGCSSCNPGPDPFGTFTPRSMICKRQYNPFNNGRFNLKLNFDPIEEIALYNFDDMWVRSYLTNLSTLQNVAARDYARNEYLSLSCQDQRAIAYNRTFDPSEGIRRQVHEYNIDYVRVYQPRTGTTLLSQLINAVSSNRPLPSLTVSGRNFDRSTRVVLHSLTANAPIPIVPLETSFVNAGQLVAFLPNFLLGENAMDNYEVYVERSKDGQRSNNKDFTINLASNAAPPYRPYSVGLWASDVSGKFWRRDDKGFRVRDQNGNEILDSSDVGGIHITFRYPLKDYDTPNYATMPGLLPNAMTLNRIQVEWRVRERRACDGVWTDWRTIPAQSAADPFNSNVTIGLPGFANRMEIASTVTTDSECEATSTIKTVSRTAYDDGFSNPPRAVVRISQGQVQRGAALTFEVDRLEYDDPASVNNVLYTWQAFWEDANGVRTPIIITPASAAAGAIRQSASLTVPNNANAQAIGVTAIPSIRYNRECFTTDANRLQGESRLLRLAIAPTLLAEYNPPTINLKLAPNPAYEQIEAHYTLEEDASVVVEVLDALQRVVATHNSKAVRGEHQITLPCTNFANGLYTIRLRAHGTSGRTVFSSKQATILR